MGVLGTDMQHSELLSTLAEVSIVFAGFTGVVGMLGFRSDNQRILGQMYQLGAMIGFSLIAAIFSLVPMLLSAVGLSDAAVWRSSSLGLLAALLGWSIVGTIRMRELRRSGYRTRRRVLAAVMNSLTVLVLLVLLANATGFLGARTEGIYLLCAFVPLLYAVFFFLRIFLSGMADARGESASP